MVEHLDIWHVHEKHNATGVDGRNYVSGWNKSKREVAKISQEDVRS